LEGGGERSVDLKGVTRQPPIHSQLSEKDVHQTQVELVKWGDEVNGGAT